MKNNKEVKDVRTHSEKIYQGAMADFFAVIKEVNDQIHQCTKIPSTDPAPKLLTR